MNRNLDGSELSIAQLIGIADDAGLDHDAVVSKIAGHGPHMARSHLLDLTRAARYDMWQRGSLTLDTRTERNSG